MLVPVIWHMTQGREALLQHTGGRPPKAVYVTANKALQDQLIRKDVPTLQRVLPWTFTAAIAKGRGNSLCLDVFDGARVELDRTPPKSPKVQAQWSEIQDWARRTQAGDFSELPFEVHPFLKPRVSISAEDCLGKSCASYGICFAEKAKGHWHDADILVTNYHLLMAHLTLGMKIMPEFDIVILDEAHELPDIAREFLGSRITPATVRYLGRLLAPSEARRSRTKLRPIDPDAQEHLYNASGSFFIHLEERFFQHLGEPQQVAPERAGDVQWDETQAPPEPAAPAAPSANETRVRIAKDNLVDASELTGALRKTAELYLKEAGVFRDAAEDPDAGPQGPEVELLERTAEKCTKLATEIDKAVGLVDSTKNAYFVELGEAKSNGSSSVTLGSLPIEVGPALKFLLFENEAFASVVATSATLSTARADGGGRLDFFVRQVGAWKASRLIVASPFDMKRQARLVVPWNAPDPKDLRAFEQGIGKLAVQVIGHARGRTLGLFASRARLTIVADLVRRQLGASYTIMVQGEAPRGQLIDRFKSDVHSVLLGTKSFWAGVDVPGQALSCVLIDRIPFPPKDDPLISWMEEAAQRDINDPKRDPQKRKPNVFFDYMLPRATIDLRQGVGRLIRAADDRGVVCIFDKRLTDMKYGARIIDALGIGDAMINMADVAAFFASDHRTHDPSGE